jgi:hypothetical protein
MDRFGALAHLGLMNQIRARDIRGLRFAWDSWCSVEEVLPDAKTHDRAVMTWVWKAMMSQFRRFGLLAWWIAWVANMSRTGRYRQFQ